MTKNESFLLCNPFSKPKNLYQDKTTSSIRDFCKKISVSLIVFDTPVSYTYRYQKQRKKIGKN